MRLIQKRLIARLVRLNTSRREDLPRPATMPKGPTAFRDLAPLSAHCPIWKIDAVLQRYLSKNESELRSNISCMLVFYLSLERSALTYEEPRQRL
jgi:hypothetical protein